MSYTAEQIANMSDDELLALDTSTLAFNSEEATDDADTTTTAAETTDTDEDTEVIADPAVDEDEDDTDTQETDPDDSEVDESNEPDPQNADEAPALGTNAEKQDTAAKEPAEVVEVPAVADKASIEAFHAKITAPFKANGRDMQVTTPEEAIQLMQMGANYNQKMRAIKPNLQMMKSLEAAGLLSQEKIDFLIDVMAKKPEAISKLVQDSGIDPLDISTEKADEYRPTSYKVSEKSLELDAVLDDLKGSDHYARTLGIVADTLDDASKQIVVDNPRVLVNLHQHIADGVFDQVWSEVERQKTFGRLTGLSDLEAYRQVGDAMASSGKLQLPAGVAPQPSQAQAPAKVVVAPKPKQADDSDRRNKRQAASPTKAAVPSSNKLPANFNPLAMSDEEIMKLDISKFV
jgi:hypothetical protein